MTLGLLRYILKLLRLTSSKFPGLDIQKKILFTKWQGTTFHSRVTFHTHRTSQPIFSNTFETFLAMFSTVYYKEERECGLPTAHYHLVSYFFEFFKKQ